MDIKKLTSRYMWLVLALAGCHSKQEQDNTQQNAPQGPAIITPQLVGEYPHDPAAFTEGLQYVNGKLYESTGEYGTSDIRITDPATGKVLLSHKLDSKYFGEGLAVLHGKVYQLTYREHTGFIYDSATLQQTGTFTFDGNEGWGMCTDGTYLIYDDGGSDLIYLSLPNMSVTKRVAVKDNGILVDEINELEYIKGYIYANRWRSDIIYKIDPQTGEVVAKADLSELRVKLNGPVSGNPPEVLNGIAYDEAHNRIFLTGKFWPKLFEVKLDN